MHFVEDDLGLHVSIALFPVRPISSELWRQTSLSPCPPNQDINFFVSQDFLSKLSEDVFLKVGIDFGIRKLGSYFSALPIFFRNEIIYILI